MATRAQKRTDQTANVTEQEVLEMAQDAYWAKAEALDGTWTPPAVERVG